MPASTPDRPRILFLDDDPVRGSAFLVDHPLATWVQTAQQCLECLAEPWDEVHLDHDLGGEVFVTHEREDCGMAVVRWLCDEPRPHLLPTSFVVHTHNPNAACVMQLHLEMVGYQVRVRPFGKPSSKPRAPGQPDRGRRPLTEWTLRWLRRLSGS